MSLKTDKILVALETDTILESVFEIRFEGSQRNISDILAGILYQKLGVDYPAIEKLPISQLPLVFRENNPDFKYQATNKFQGNRCVLLVGDNVVTVSKHAPYEGWSIFKKRIIKCLNTLESTKLVKKVERIALRYTNFIQTGRSIFGDNDIRFSGTLGSYDLTKYPCHVRTEIQSDTCLGIVHVTSNTILAANNDLGTILDIDAQSSFDLKEFWKNKAILISKVHDFEKQIFTSILSAETLSKLKPTWR